MELSLYETRVIGALIEKELTTPDQYPLSLNSLTLACNQKSNREPVLTLSESEVQEVLDSLEQKKLISQVVFGSRVPKYKHRFCNTEFSKLHLNPQELGIICVLFLRGPQTPGELRTRTNRLCKFDDSVHVETVLQRLASREDGPFVVKMNREPGKRESRYAHLFSGEVDVVAVSAVTESSGMPSGASAQDYISRIETLEEQVAMLREEVESLKQMWES